jgi:hypothetical protein
MQTQAEVFMRPDMSVEPAVGSDGRRPVRRPSWRHT